MLVTVPLSLVDVGDRLRSISEEQVAAVAASIAEVGLLNPITVFEKKVIDGNILVDGFGVIAGAHRLAAVRRLGHTEIAAQVLNLSDLQRQIAECDENLSGPKLTPAERAMFTKRRKDAYEALHPETKHGENQHTRSRQVGDSSTDRFTADTAAKSGRSERDVQRDSSRGEKVSEAALKEIKGTSLDTGVVLDRIAREPSPEAQLAAIKREQDKAEAHKRNKGTDRIIALTEAQQFADWLMARTDMHEMVQLIAWLQVAKGTDVIAAMRREAA